MVFNKKLKNLFVIILLIILFGCAHQYTFNSKSYTSANDALNAHREYLQEIQNEIISNDTTPKGNAIIITPSKNTCEALGITRKGSPTEDMINYLGTYLEEDYAFFSKYLVKSNLFMTVNHVINDFPAQYANNVKNEYSATIYLDMKSPTQTSWFIMVSPENTPKQIHFDNMAKNGTLKIQSWIYDIKEHI